MHRLLFSGNENERGGDGDHGQVGIKCSGLHYLLECHREFRASEATKHCEVSQSEECLQPALRQKATDD